MSVFNDLWAYVFLSQSWVKYSGTQINNDVGNYPLLNVVNSTSLPAARYEHSAVFDQANAVLWIFGGNRGNTC